VSLLTTVHGTEQYLPEAVESVLAQTDPEWELVVVDNGWSPLVAEIMQRYACDDRIRFIRQENRGYAGGVMAAAASATGGLIAVLDSDDQIMPTFVRRMRNFVRDRPTADAVGCDAHLFIDGERRGHTNYLRSIGHRSPPTGGRRLPLRLVLEGYVPYYTGVVRRAAWDSCRGYDLAAQGVEEDVLLWLRLTSRGEVWVLPDKLARCRVRDDSLSRDPHKVEAFEERMIATFERFAAMSGEPAHMRAVRKPIRRIRYNQSLRRARQAFLAGETETARTNAREAVRHRATARSVAVVLLLRVAPDLLVLVHPLKHRLQELVRTARSVLRRQTP
jgi:glycosyltransferase involved in cell wall biosynthesis